jgi:quinone-reactive Ni/Fe-hydrogenase large subunit
MSKHLVIDPITRIEGHLRIEAIVDDNNTIIDAYSSSTMFRGIETILKGRDPRDCGLMAMRICGVCTGTHYQRSIEAVEHAFNVTIPQNARLVRNLIQGALYVHDHPVHFYHLHGLDWVDILSALKADPAKAVEVAHKYSQTPYNSSVDRYKAVMDRVSKFAAQGRLGLFANGYWGNKSYKFSPEENLVILSHYLDALDVQREMAKMMAIFGGKNPHPQSIVVGGVTCVQDIQNPSRIAQFNALLKKSTEFVKNAYIPDVLLAGTVYKDEALAGVGGGLGNFMSYGAFRMDDNPMYKGEMLFPSGIVLNKDLSKVLEIDQKKITEDVTHSWYKGNDNLHPFEGKTEPHYTGLDKKENIAYLKTAEKYSWIKSPLYNDTRMEVGPLARLIVGFAKGDKRIKSYVENFLKVSGLPATVLFSTVGRTAARAIETEMMCDVMVEWSNQLLKNVTTGNLDTWTKFDFDKVSKNAEGFGMEEAPRGALGHWVKIKDGKVENYQAIVPSTWNAAPRDYKNRKGAYEESLIGTKMANPNEPLEIIRTIHSFDPCIACAVHIVDTRGKQLAEYRVDPLGGVNESC